MTAADEGLPPSSSDPEHQRRAADPAKVLLGPPGPLLRVLGKAAPTVSILDIGALDNGTTRYAALEEAGHASVWGVEPQTAAMDVLKRRHPQRNYLPFVLGDGADGVFRVCRYPGCSSLYEPDMDVIKQFEGIGENFGVIRRVPTATVRLDDISGLPAFDMIKVDVQGAERDILQAGQKMLPSVLLVETEVEFVPLYKDQPLFGDVDVFMRSQGFFLHKLIDLGGRCYRPFRTTTPTMPVSQLLWADAIYIRRLDTLTAEELVKLALICDSIYKSTDLVYTVLDRVNKNVAERYLDVFRLAGGLPLPLVANFCTAVDYISS